VGIFDNYQKLKTEYDIFLFRVDEKDETIKYLHDLDLVLIQDVTK